MRFKDFELRKCKENGVPMYELVKWFYDKELERELCYVVAFIRTYGEGYPKEGWQFESVGMRFIDDYEPGLVEYIQDCMTWIQKRHGY